MVPQLRSDAWRSWFGLSEGQTVALQNAVEMAENSPLIQELLARDLAALDQDLGVLPSSQSDIAKAWGQAMCYMHYVVLFSCRLPWLIEQYRDYEISDNILKDTLTDIPLWMDACRERTGYYGLLNQGFILNHFRFRLFRLGRLEYMASVSRVPAFVYRNRFSEVVTALCPGNRMYTQVGEGAGTNGGLYDGVWLATRREETDCVYGYPIHPSGYVIRQKVALDKSAWQLVLKPTDPVIEIHIPSGSKLDPREVEKSLESAPSFFRVHFKKLRAKALVCTSWLLDDTIAQMQPGGNIAAFQRFFYRVPLEKASDRQMRERVFHDLNADILSTPRTTSLQKAISAWYSTGRCMKNSSGFILLRDQLKEESV